MYKRVIILLLVAYVCFSMFRLSLGVALPSIMLDFSINEAQAGWLYSAPLWSTAILLTPSGYLADRFGQKRILLCGYLLLAIGVTTIGFSQGYLGCLGSLVIAGVGAGILIPSYYSMVGEALKRGRGLAIGLAAGVYLLGGLIGSILVGFFIAQQQWRLAYFIIGVLIFLMIIVQFVSIKPSFTQTKSGTGLNVYPSLIRMIRTRNVVISSISIFISSIVFFATVAWLPTFLLSSIRLDAISVGVVFGVFLLIGAVSSPVLGAVSDRIGRRSLTCITGITSAAISIPMFTTQYSFWPSIGYSLILGFFVIPAWNLLIAIVQESVSKESIASVTGITQTFGLIGSAVGPVIAGTLITIFSINQGLIYTITPFALIYGLLALTTIETRRK